MNRSLRYDEETRELRVVLIDHWKDRHEYFEYRLIDDDGRPLRGERFRHWDGRRVGWNRARYFVNPENALQQPVYFDSEQKPAVSETASCPRYTNRRRRCDICRAMEART